MGYEIDVEKLRQDMMDDYGPAMFNGFPMAVIDLSRIERASDWELIEIARDQGIDLDKYVLFE